MINSKKETAQKSEFIVKHSGIAIFAMVAVLWAVSPDCSRAQTGDSTCWASGDINQDGIILSVSDLVEFMRILTDSTSQIPWHEADLNGDCVVDTADIRKYADYFIHGISIWPFYPVATCCNPDIRWVCCLFRRGNVDGDTGDLVNIVDVTHLANYLFQGGPPPFCRDEGNVNGDPSGAINVVDLTFLVNRLFNGGPEPPNCMPNWPF